MPLPITRRVFLTTTACSIVFPRSARAIATWRIAAFAERSGLQPGALDRLRASITGGLVLPTDPSFDSVRRVWSFNPLTDKRPAVVVQCADQRDVATAVRFAREHSLEIAVRSGGHDILGASVCERGLVIDLSRMKKIDVNPVTRTAVVQTGAISGEVSRACAANDLAAVLGCNPSVGVGGLTLGGGLGFFLGTHGAACDNLLGANLITADGSSVAVNAQRQPELFWAIRGGGGNFGVATQFTLQLHKTDVLLAGVVAFRVKEVGPFLRFYRDFMARAADPLVVELSIFAERDEIAIWALTNWSGDPRDGEAAVEPLRTFVTPTADTIESLPLRRMFYRMPPRLPARSDTVAAPPQRPETGPRNTHWRGGTVAVLSDEVIARMTSAIARAPRGWQLGVGHYMHGQVCRVGDAETPLVRRSGHSTYFVSASWGDETPPDAPMQWVDDSWQAIESLSRTATYVNYLSVGTEDAVRATYGANYMRLSALKRTYDPDNALHLNRNIRPART